MPLPTRLSTPYLLFVRGLCDAADWLAPIDAQHSAASIRSQPALPNPAARPQTHPPACPLLPSPLPTQAEQELVSARSAASAGAMSLPDSARQREQAAALQAALQHSAAEVEDLLGALDTAAAAAAATAAGQASGDDSVPAQQPETESGAALEAGLLSLRDRLAERHRSVQVAAARMQAAAADAERLKAQHADLRQRVSASCWRQASSCVVGTQTLPLPLPASKSPLQSSQCASALPLPASLPAQVEDQQSAVDDAQDGMEAALEQKQDTEAALAR